MAQRPRCTAWLCLEVGLGGPCGRFDGLKGIGRGLSRGVQVAGMARLDGLDCADASLHQF